MLSPSPPPYDPLEWLRKPFAERGRMVCEAWAMQGYGTPLGAYALHVVKIGLYVGVWILFVGFTPGMGGLGTLQGGGSSPSPSRRRSCGACSSRAWVSAAAAAR